MLDLVIRAMSAIGSNAKAREGSTTWDGEPHPPLGKRSQDTEKSITKMMPKMNPGTLANTVARAMEKKSTEEFFRAADVAIPRER